MTTLKGRQKRTCQNRTRRPWGVAGQRPAEGVAAYGAAIAAQGETSPNTRIFASDGENYMKTLFPILLTAMMLTMGCHDSSESKSRIGGTCATSGDCDQADGKVICANSICIVHCAQTGCGQGLVCADSGICAKEPKPIEERECSQQKPCTAPNKVCGSDYTCITGECSQIVPCTGGLVCNSTNICVECASSHDCIGDKVCAPDGTCVECISNVNCASRGLICDLQSRRCIADKIERCSAGSCPAGQVCALDGNCFEGECSPVDTCAEGLFCQNNKCVSRDELVCYQDNDCGEGFGCDKNRCVADNTCSLTRPCAEGLCHEGKCIEKAPYTCDKEHSCADAAKTCVAGICVECECDPGQICTVNGSCIDPAFSAAKNIREGDTCVWTKDFAFCDENRVFTCSSEPGSDTAHVNVQNCGARACATANENGVGCYDTCLPLQNTDFYGVCIENGSETIAFTWQCDITPEGAYVWSLQHGYNECLIGCTNGRCDFVPPEFNQTCTTATYPDACQGNWLTYCYSTSSSAAYGGIQTGTYCTDSKFCAIPSKRALDMDATIIANCVDACETAGETKRVCMHDEDGKAYSYLYLCAATTDGRLGSFPLDHDFNVCPDGCDDQTGECK